MDLALASDLGGVADLAVVDDDLASDGGLRTALLLSLFLDRRAEADDEIPAGDGDRRGWWADQFSDVPDDLIGSRLWLLDRSALRSGDDRRAEDYCREALAWLVADRVLERFDVAVSSANQRRDIVVTVYRPDSRSAEFRFPLAWDAEAALL